MSHHPDWSDPDLDVDFILDEMRDSGEQPAQPEAPADVGDGLGLDPEEPAWRALEAIVTGTATGADLETLRQYGAVLLGRDCAECGLGIVPSGDDLWVHLEFPDEPHRAIPACTCDRDGTDAFCTEHGAEDARQAHPSQLGRLSRRLHVFRKGE